MYLCGAAGRGAASPSRPAPADNEGHCWKQAYGWAWPNWMVGSLWWVMADPEGNESFFGLHDAPPIRSLAGCTSSPIEGRYGRLVRQRLEHTYNVGKRGPGPPLQITQRIYSLCS